MKNMRKVLALLLAFCMLASLGMTAMAQETFKVRIENKEYSVFMDLNLYEETIKIPGQEILGETFGYLKKTNDSRVWIVTGVEVDADGRKATLEITNDYGSEDLIATLTLNADGTYTLRQESGSTLKVAGKSKWVKLPKTLTFKIEGFKN